MSTRYGNGPQQGNGFCGYIVGQHVVCVNDKWPRGRERELREILPVKGVVYTVRWVGMADGKLGLRLVEIVNKPLAYLDGRRELCFSVHRFRPLQKLTPEMFMSADAPVKQGEPA